MAASETQAPNEMVAAVHFTLLGYDVEVEAWGKYYAKFHGPQAFAAKQALDRDTRFKTEEIDSGTWGVRWDA